MPSYICYFCNKQFFQRCHLQNHLIKKYKCKIEKYDINNNLKTDISREDVLLMFESDEYHNLFLENENMILDSKKTPKDSKKTPKRLQKTPKCTGIPAKLIKCEYCHKVFTRMNNKNRHIREKRCHILKNNSQIIHNTQNNIQNNITINNTQNNIHINCYGKEDLSYITKDILKDIIKKPLSGIPKLVEMIHLNPLHPENNNIKLVNKNQPYLDYFNGSLLENSR